MKNDNTFSVKARARSIKHAFEGIAIFFKEEHNARIHLVATILVIMLSIIFTISLMELIVLILAVGFVWVAELFNTAIEKMMDFIMPEQNDKIKLIKDLSAAAVLIAALTAFATGCFIFIPKL